ncbi:MAG: inositol monophosphatase [Halopseudomonas aestusnigri]|nr:inositol monophosphatase [Halopseudomonas aestusnigri]
MDDDSLLETARRAAARAASVQRDARGQVDPSRWTVKGRSDFTTEVDVESERLIVSTILERFPDHGVLAEEGTEKESDGEQPPMRWCIDPLDGTTNFIRGVPHFAVSIACRVKGRIEHAVILDPIRQEEFTASRGRGAALNGRRLRVSNRKSLEGALLGTGFPFRANQVDSLDNYLGMFRSLVGQTAGIRRAGAASLDLAYVAAGRFDAFWEFGLAEWDMAAGALLIQEAGGLVSDFSGGHQFLDKGHIVAGNPKCFKAVLTAIQPHLTPGMKM